MLPSPVAAEGQPIGILGVRVDPLTVEGLHARMDALIARRERSLVLNVNVHALNLACRHPWFRDFLNRARIVFCDGSGVILGARILGHRIPERITYADWLWKLARHCAERGHTIYLLGGRPGIAGEAARRLEAHAPGLQVRGCRDGYFDKTPAGAENRRVLADIDAARPDILVVCFGMPLQERWIKENLDALQVPVILTGGAALDYASGNLRRGPDILVRHHMEWLARLVIDPRRLWRRYVLGNPLFLARVLAQAVGLRSGEAPPPPP